MRVLVAAGALAIVSILTFAVLLNALLDQRRAAAASRETVDALYAATQVDRALLDPPSRELSQAVDRLVAIPNDGVQRERIARLRADIAAARFPAAAAVLDEIERAERAEQMERRAETITLRDRSIAIAAVGLAVLLALIALLSWAAVRAIVIPVGRLQRFARDLGERRYGARLPETGLPETAELAHAFNATAVNLAAAEAELRKLGERRLAELDAVFREAPLGLAFVDRELRFLRVNEALAGMNDRPAADHLGREIRNDDVRGALQEVLRSGEPVLDRELTIGGRTFLASYFPVRDGGDDFLAVGAAVIDVTERMRAEAARERLQAATASLAAAVNVGDAARATVIEAGRALSTTSATLFLIDHGSVILVEERGLPLETRAEWSALSLRTPVPAAECIRVGHAIYVTDHAELMRRWPLLEGLKRTDGSRSFAALPLIVSGRPLGALALSFSETLAFDAGERDLLEALATQCAVALARAQLYEREHAVAQTLQASLLPRALPEIPGLDLAARLHGGTPGLEVGGDFYDAFALPGGWGVAIGDVCGKGVDAAALTALARHTMRAAAHEGHAPGAVLRALNRAVLAETRPGEFLTAIFARLAERAGGGFDLALSCGGHPPPVLVDRAGAIRPLECSGTLLGVVDDPEVTELESGLDPGDALLLYTDGLTEAGAPQRTLTTADVAEWLAAARAGTAAETAERCLARAIETAGGELRDDVAVVVGQVV
jgi:serine phosphatase RsbU (regulator of sigma subunit)/PAS domain-containing protein